MQQQRRKSGITSINSSSDYSNDEINAATTNAQVETAVQNGETNISNVIPQTQTKTNAKIKLIKQQQIKNAAIEQNQRCNNRRKRRS